MSLLRMLSFAAIAVLLAAVIAGFDFIRWRRRAKRRLLGDGSIVQTARGPIDCGLAGPADGPAVLVLHGGLGGWDQGIWLAGDLGLMRAFRVIAPSRPGYLRTPLEVGRTAHEAADAMAALLDALGVQRAVVVGISGGGPTAVALATRHPGRVRALVMICAISHHHVQPGITTGSLFGRVLFSSAGGWVLDFFSWVALRATRFAPAFMTRRILSMTELADRREIRERVRALRRDPQRLGWTLRLLEHSFPISPRRVGLRNDLDVFASLGERIEEPITVPVLVVHGRIDGNVPVAHAKVTLVAAREAESLIIDDASHLLWLHPRAEKIGARVRAFVASAPA